MGARRISRADGVPGGVEVGVGSEDASPPTRSRTGCAVATDPTGAEGVDLIIKRQLNGHKILTLRMRTYLN